MFKKDSLLTKARFVSSRGEAPQLSVVPYTSQQHELVFMLCSLLLDYPSLQWNEIVDSGIEELANIPVQVADSLQKFLFWTKQVGQGETEKLYVHTFDQKRRCCLELSYYATGDTRQRGIALTIFQDLYAAVGWVQDGMHLPDYLPSVLELAARCEGESLQLVNQAIASHREGIEVLHKALIDLDSPWAHVVAALRMMLPKVDKETYLRMQKLIRQGPPSELVGIHDVTDLPWPQMQISSDKLKQPIAEG